ncbi:MAG: GLPGLI family protein [Bacteroidetes bacterium]|nr:GLPGLI family protein [Bacteroidota bacterium]
MKSFFFVLLSSLLWGQINNPVNVVIYEQNFGKYTTTIDKTVLYSMFDKDTFLQFEFQKDKNTPTDSISLQTFDLSKQSENAQTLRYQKTENNNFYVTGLDYYSLKYYLMNDSFMPRWKIIPQQYKEILGYTCEKAESNFRGKKWIVWYTKNIPSPFGPWKLRGLPGLILEATDEDGYYTFTAVQIKLNTNYTFNKSVVKYFEDEIPKAIPYKSFVEIDNKNKKTTIEKLQSTLPSGSSQDFSKSLLNRDLELEKSFEWEKEPLK